MSDPDIMFTQQMIHILQTRCGWVVDKKENQIYNIIDLFIKYDKENVDLVNNKEMIKSDLRNILNECN